MITDNPFKDALASMFFKEHKTTITDVKMETRNHMTKYASGSFNMSNLTTIVTAKLENGEVIGAAIETDTFDLHRVEKMCEALYKNMIQLKWHRLQTYNEAEAARKNISYAQKRKQVLDQLNHNKIVSFAKENSFDESMR